MPDGIEVVQQRDGFVVLVLGEQLTRPLERSEADRVVACLSDDLHRRWKRVAALERTWKAQRRR